MQCKTLFWMFHISHNPSIKRAISCGHGGCRRTGRVLSGELKRRHLGADAAVCGSLLRSGLLLEVSLRHRSLLYMVHRHRHRAPTRLTTLLLPQVRTGARRFFLV